MVQTRSPARWRPAAAEGILVLLVLLVVALAARTGFSAPLGAGWRDELLDWLGIGIACGGALLLGAHPTSVRRAGAWLVGVGLACVLGNLALAAACMLALCLTLARPGRWTHTPAAEPPALRGSLTAQARRLVVSSGALVCGIAALALLLEIWEDLTVPGGPAGNTLELGACGTLVALLLLVRSALCGELAALTPGSGPAAAPAAQATLSGRCSVPSPAGPLAAAALLFAAFLLLALAIQAPAVARLDARFVHFAYRSGGSGVGRLMHAVSNAGGRDLVVYWLPAMIAGLLLARRGRALPFFLSTMLGILGLETVFKTLLHRLRPDLVRGVHFDSFPSGHALAAAVLAGTLLLVLLPACSRTWQRAALWSAAAAWTFLMAASRVYLGRHFLTDVTGGILLGAAWVCFCLTVLRCGTRLRLAVG